MRTGAALLLAVVLTACASTGDNPFEVADGSFRLQLPDGWSAQATEPTDWQRGMTVAILSTDQLQPVCPSDGTGACSQPADHLADGQLLVWWRTATCAAATCELPDADRLLVGGRAASHVSDAVLCDGLGATGSEAYFVAVSPQRLDAIVVCQRDASPEAQEQLRAMLETVRWRTP